MIELIIKFNQVFDQVLWLKSISSFKILNHLISKHASFKISLSKSGFLNERNYFKIGIIKNMSNSSSTAAIKKIGTHNGSFHCDEILGCWLLKQTETFKEAQILRTRNPEILKELDIVIDVGGVFNIDALRFDHHQKGFYENFGHGYQTKLSSAGLVYKYFGKEIIQRLLLSDNIDDKTLHVIYLNIYKGFIEAVDAIDNGINQWESDEPPKYQINTTLSSRVSFLNPIWNEENSDAIQEIQFKKGMDMCGSEFIKYLNFLYKSWYPAKLYVENAIKNRYDNHPSGKVICLEKSCPWKEHLYELEKEYNIVGLILYCIYEDTFESNWRIQAVSVSQGSFENRKTLPSSWLGLRGDTLNKVSGIDGCVFVHINGFIGGNKTKEGILQMASLAVDS